MIMNDYQFYPTPAPLAEKMLRGIDFRLLESVLEPSAGKADLIEKLNQMRRDYYHRPTMENVNTDCIEKEPLLANALRGMGYRVIHDDFLTFETYKVYNLILMNPPFANGDQHLLKAISLQERCGGEIRCLLNASTIREPKSNTEKLLARKLELYKAKVEYAEHAFSNAERKTDVEVALITISIPKPMMTSNILKGLKEKHHRFMGSPHQNALNFSDPFEASVADYNFEVEAGIRLLNEFHILSEFTEKSPFSLTIGGNQVSINNYVKAVRRIYWGKLLNISQFSKLLTERTYSEFHSKMTELQEYDYSIYNIKQMMVELSSHMSQNIEQCIVDLFDDFSHKYSWMEGSSNVHYYNGWATNMAWKINKKVIILLNGYDFFGDYNPDDYKVIRRIEDMQKVFCYLEGGLHEHDISQTLKRAKADQQTKNISFKYFRITFYKKGTCHVEFTDLELLKKFNLYGSQRKGWLPPSYGQKKYDDLTPNEKIVIDSYEGREVYEKVRQKAYYFLEQPKCDLFLTESEMAGE